MERRRKEEERIGIIYLEMEQLFHRFRDIFFQLQRSKVYHEGSY